MELRRHAIKKGVPCDDMNCKLKIPHSAKVGSGFGHFPKNVRYSNVTVRSTFSIRCHKY